MSNYLSRLARKLRKTFFPSAHQREYKRWVSDGGDENLRLDYDLTEDSLVIDLGGYKGQWASDIYSRFNCSVWVFEPLPSFAEKIEARFRNNDSITVFGLALGASRRKEDIVIAEDRSSVFLNTGDKVSVQFEDVADFFESHNISHCDLMKINIEGGEYELLNRMLDTGLVARIKDLQIQFHKLDDKSDAERESICRRLSTTHRPTYQYKFIWENWTRKEAGNARSE